MVRAKAAALAAQQAAEALAAQEAAEAKVREAMARVEAEARAREEAEAMARAEAEAAALAAQQAAEALVAQEAAEAKAREAMARVEAEARAREEAEAMARAEAEAAALAAQQAAEALVAQEAAEAQVREETKAPLVEETTNYLDSELKEEVEQGCFDFLDISMFEREISKQRLKKGSEPFLPDLSETSFSTEMECDNTEDDATLPDLFAEEADLIQEKTATASMPRVIDASREDYFHSNSLRSKRPWRDDYFHSSNLRPLQS